MNKKYFFKNIIIALTLVSVVFCKPYKGGELRTDDTYRYGRFEVRMKSAYGNGVVSSFFTYRDFWEEGHTSNSYWNEIDFEWLGNYDDKVQTNLIIQNAWDLPELVDLGVSPHESFHTYAIEWTPSDVKFFIEDQLIRIVNNFYADSLYHYQKLMMNIWQPIYDDWVGDFNPSILPVYAFYDWVKYYAYVPNSGNAGTDNNFILFWEDEFDFYDTSRWSKANHTWDGNNSDLIYSNVVFESGYLILCLTTPQDTGYNGDPLSINTQGIPSKVSLGSPYPNPFNHNITLPVFLSESGIISFSIYDIKGKQIKSKEHQFLNSGENNIFWNGSDRSGKQVSSGTYYLHIQNEGRSQVEEILFLK
ncbi:MAG: hypothetical protein CMG62_07970 [Candidatus Marinimicrobia bacterium]|nr:hypothetical protein [Candidatus Neomarinimicrobiota bacterium]